MSRLPKWAVITLGVILFLFAVMGIMNSVHTMAKVVYPLLIATSIAVITVGFRPPTGRMGVDRGTRRSPSRKVER
jgi:hypothetical protein